jgi:hypothetical protein
MQADRSLAALARSAAAAHWRQIIFALTRERADLLTRHADGHAWLIA